MRVFLVSCLLVAFAQAQYWQQKLSLPNPDGRRWTEGIKRVIWDSNLSQLRTDHSSSIMMPADVAMDRIRFTLTNIQKKLGNLASQPSLLSGGNGNKQALSEAKTVAMQAKKLFDDNSKKIQTIMMDATQQEGGKLTGQLQRLQEIKTKLSLEQLNKGDAKLLSNMLVQGIENQNIKLHDKLTNTVMDALNKDTAPAGAKLLLSRMLSMQLKEDTHKQMKQLTALMGGGDDGVSDDDKQDLDAEVDDDEEVGDDDDSGVHDDGVDDDGVDDEAVGDDAVHDSGVLDEGVRDYDSGPEPPFSHKKKQLCIYTQIREYCITQAKNQ